MGNQDRLFAGNIPLSTIAPLKLIRDLPENFVLLNGDVLTDVDSGKLYEEHVSQATLHDQRGGTDAYSRFRRTEKPIPQSAYRFSGKAENELPGQYGDLHGESFGAQMIPRDANTDSTI